MAHRQSCGTHFSLQTALTSVKIKLDFVRQHEVASSLADLPDEENVQLALSQVKNGKAAGSFGVLPEMLKVGQESREFICTRSSYWLTTFNTLAK